MFLEFQRAGHYELLVAASGAWSTVHCYGDFADGDEAKARMNGAQLVETLEQITCGVGVVPVVAAIVDDGVIAGLLRKVAGVFNQVVA